MILRFKPISKCFQSPKHVIKVKDLRLTLIDITVPKFLTEPPPPGTQDAGLLAQLATKLLYSHEQTIPSDEEREEPICEPTQADIEKNFEVFYRADSEDTPDPNNSPCVTAQISTNQEAFDIPEGMVLEEKTPDLLALLTAHAGGNAPAVPVVPRPPTLVSPHPFTA